MTLKNRIFYYDMLRAFAIFAVVLCHVDGMIGYSFSSIKHAIPGLLTTIALTGVPIFLMLTGALLLNRDYSLIDFYKRRYSRILYPFIFWMIITILIGVICFSWSNQEVLDEFFGITSHTWYIWTLIGIYLFLPVINSFLKEYQLKGLELFLIVWIITLLFNTYNPPLLHYLKFENFAGFVGYAVLGYYLDNKKFSLSDKKMLYIGILIFIIATAVHMFVMYNEIEAYSKFYLNVIVASQATGIFLIIKYWHLVSIDGENIFNKIKSSFIGKAIVSVSICSYGMYFAHYILIKYFEGLNIHSLKLLPVVLVFILFVSWLVTYILAKIPKINKIAL